MGTPQYLKPFLDKTPLAVERLKLAWSALSDWDRIFLLSSLFNESSNEKKATISDHLRKQVIELALSDKNPYIRYLGAKEGGSLPPLENIPESSENSNDRHRYEESEVDPSLLVHSAYLENLEVLSSSHLLDAPTFWNRPQIERLAIVTSLQAGGEDIAKLLRYVIKELHPKGVVRIEEILDVLLQYLNFKPISERLADSEESAIRHNDGAARVLGRTSVQALWEVIPELPPILAYPLIQTLPITEAVSSILSTSLFESFNEHQLEHLLLREDIPLKEFRRTLYRESTNTKIRRAAVSNRQFELRDSDITELDYAPSEPLESGKKKIKELTFLALWCKSATQFHLEVITDLIQAAPKDFFSEREGWDKAEGQQALEALKVKRQIRVRPKEEVLSLYLYRLARHLSQMKAVENSSGQSITSPEKLLHQRPLIVPHRAWQTYLNLKGIFRFDRHLVRLPEWMKTLSPNEQTLFVLTILLGTFLLYR